MRKKDLPLTILNQMNEFKKNFPEVSRIVKAENCLIRYEDQDQESDFFFQINSFDKSANEFVYSITYKPTSENATGERSRSLNFAGVTNALISWGNIVNQYNSTNFFIDNLDPIVEFYTEEFFTEYKLVEEDADYRPFELKRQLLISAYLEKAVEHIDQIPELEVRDSLKIAREIAISLNSRVTELTKNEVMFRLSNFWAETRRKGLPIFKDIFLELAKELVNEFGKKMIGL